MSLINVSNLTFAYDGSYDNIFENISFQLDTNWKLGLTGRNGRGKTTLLNLLLGRYEYQGSISASVEFSYFPFPVEDMYAFTSEVVETIAPNCPQWVLLKEFSQLELDEEILYRPFITLSNGERTKVLLAVLFQAENHFLLIDEPTNHLDMHGRTLVSQYLNTKKGFILVSHDRAFLDGCIDHVMAINRATIDIQKGNFSSWMTNKQLEDSFAIEENERLIGEIHRLQKSSREKSGWSDAMERTKVGQGIYDKGYVGHKSAKMMARAKAIEHRQELAIEEKKGLLKNLEKSDPLKLTLLSYHAHRMVELREVSLYYGDDCAVSNVSFCLETGDRIALRGANGSGKSSILKLICGDDIRYTGFFERGSQLKISRVLQDASGLSGSLHDYAISHGIDETRFLTILRKLDFARVQFEKNMQDFSGGQKKKVLIARSLCEEAHLLVWDEPMNYIDVISRMQIEELLLEFKPTIIFDEHDKVFCEKIATKIIDI